MSTMLTIIDSFKEHADRSKEKQGSPAAKDVHKYPNRRGAP